MKTYLIPAVLLLALAACKHKDNNAAVKMVMPAAIMSPPDHKAVRLAPPKAKADIDISENVKADYIAETDDKSVSAIVRDTSKKIIKQGDIRFESKDLVATRKMLLRNLAKLGGYLDEDNEALESESEQREYLIKARIPAKNFDCFLDSLTAGAVKIDSKHISVSDVTTQYIDMASRLRNQKLLEATYLNLLKRASKMSDVLQVEDKLTDTRSEIDSEQGQLNYLDKQLACSSLEITFYTRHVQRETGNTAGYKFTTAFSDGWHILQALAYGIITLWPFVLISIAALILIRRWKKGKKVKAMGQL